MDLLTLVILAFGLSMDAFAVSISNGIAYGASSHKKIIITAFVFGFFQALMPTIGYFAGVAFSDIISAIDHWIALVLLGFIGGKMILDAIEEMKNPVQECGSCELDNKTLLMQAIATSIDALAVGVSFAALDVNIFSGGILIGLITFVCCLVGGFLGKKLGDLFASKATILGGIILIGLGIKIFLEHTLG